MFQLLNVPYITNFESSPAPGMSGKNLYTTEDFVAQESTHLPQQKTAASDGELALSSLPTTDLPDQQQVG